MKRGLIILGLIFGLVWQAQASHAQVTNSNDVKVFDDVDLLFTFQGKGSSLFYDAGVISYSYEKIAALQQNRVVIAGNSSGSIWAAYFANKGFNQESIGALAPLSTKANVSAIRQNENISFKLTKVLRKQETEMPPSVLFDAIAIALDVADISDCKSVSDIARKSTWKPNHPFVIVAANLDTIGHLEEQSRNLIDRRIDSETYDMYWIDEAFENYSQHPEEFKKQKQLVTWNGEKRIGKAATYFCDPATFALLSRLPESERLADLRLVTTPADAALAIHASLAEPTYFAPIEEFDYSKLELGAGLGVKRNIQKRIYYGGFIMPVIAQDLRRMLPQTYALGTGWIGLPKLVRVYFDKRWGLDVELMHHKSNWWLDAELRPSGKVERQITARKLTTEEEYALGRESAQEALANGVKPPQYVVPCKLNWHPANAIYRGDAVQANAKVETLRGIDALLAN